MAPAQVHDGAHRYPSTTMGGRAPSPKAHKGQKVGTIWPNTGEPLERIAAQPRSCTHTKQQQNASLRANYRVQVQRVFLSTDRVEQSEIATNHRRAPLAYVMMSARTESKSIVLILYCAGARKRCVA